MYITGKGFEGSSVTCLNSAKFLYYHLPHCASIPKAKEMMAFPLSVSGILGDFLLLLKLLIYAKYISKRMCLYLTSVLDQLLLHLLVGYNQVGSGMSFVVVSPAPSSIFFFTWYKPQAFS